MAAEVAMIQKTYVRQDPGGGFKVGESRVSLDSVVYAYLEGCSAESIADDFPGLTAEEVHGAIAFYLANRDEVHAYLDKQRALWDKLRADIDARPSAKWDRLRQIKRERESQA
jgi:uncharacterized protein (DUF433 family)